MSLGKLVVSLALDAAGYEQGTKEAAEAGERLEKRLQLAMDNIAKYGAIAGGVLVTGLTAAFNTAVNRMDAFDELSERIGVSVDQLQRLAYAGQMTGVTQEDLASALQRVSVNAGKALDGNAKLTRGFNAMGIEVRELKGLTPEQIFQRLADAVAGSNDSAQRNAVLTQLLGKNYSTLVPLLSQGADGLKALGDEAENFGLVSGPEAAKQAALFKDNVDRLKGSLLGLAQDMATTVLPAINSVVTDFIEARKEFGNWDQALAAVFFATASKQAAAIESLREAEEALAKAQERRSMIESPEARERRLKSLQREVDDRRRMVEFYERANKAQEASTKALKESTTVKPPTPGGRQITGGDDENDGTKKATDFERYLDKVRQLNQEVALSTENLSAVEKKAGMIRAELRDKTLDLSTAQRQQIEGELRRAEAVDGYARAQQRAKDALTAFRDAQFKAEQGAIAQRDRQAEVVAQLERELEQIGLTADALAQLKDKRLGEAIALEKQKLAAMELNTAATEPELAAIRERIRLLEREREVRNSIFNKEASTKAQAEQDATVKRLADQVEQGVGEAFLLAVTGRGREAAERLRKMFVETFAKDAFELILDIKAKNGKGGVGSIWDVLVSLYDFLGAEFGLFGKSGTGKTGGSKASSSKSGGMPSSKLGLDGASRLATISNVGPVSGLLVSSGLSSGPAGASASMPTINYSPTVIVNGDGVSRSDLALALEENRSITMAQLADMVNRRDPRSPV